MNTTTNPMPHSPEAHSTDMNPRSETVFSDPNTYNIPVAELARQAAAIANGNLINTQPVEAPTPVLTPEAEKAWHVEALSLALKYSVAVTAMRDNELESEQN